MLRDYACLSKVRVRGEPVCRRRALLQNLLEFVYQLATVQNKTELHHLVSTQKFKDFPKILKILGCKELRLFSFRTTLEMNKLKIRT